MLFGLPLADARLRGVARGRDGGVREELAKAIGNDQDRAGADHGGGAAATQGGEADRLARADFAMPLSDDEQSPAAWYPADSSSPPATRRPIWFGE
jgi:hypothetical protein